MATGVAGGVRGTNVAETAQAAAARYTKRTRTARTDTTRMAGPKLAVVIKTGKRVAAKKAKKVSGASKKRKGSK